MWKKRMLALILCAGLAGQLLPGTLAAEPAGLAAFLDQKSYTQGIFTDVAASDWYAPGVEKVYTKGIMEGTGAGTFAPGSTVTWSQAVTIAARLHGTYHGKEIPQAEGAWYERYLRYAEAEGLLPAFCPEAADGEAIPREGMALLFAGVLAEKDLPAVNDQAIPDLDQAREDCREAVERMYAAGIITGKSGGAFDPKGKATRAEMATIVTRLLCPGQRVSHDSRVNPNMAEQLGNYYNGGLAARLGDTVYYICKEQVNKEQREYLVMARTDEGKCRVAHQTGEALHHLSVGPDGKLYALQDGQWEGEVRQHRLCRLDPKGGEAETVYETPLTIESYQFYDGQLYLGLGDCRAEAPGQWKYQISRLKDGRLEPLVKDLSWDDSAYIAAESFYLFGGKLYYTLSKNYEKILYVQDIAGGEPKHCYGGYWELAFQSGTFWALEGEDNGPVNLYRGSLALPGERELVAELTQTVGSGAYTNLYANGTELYLQAYGDQKMWQISSKGELTHMADLYSYYVQYSTVTGQGIILQVLSEIEMQFVEQIEVVLPDGGKTNYPAFLGRAYCLSGKDKFEATDYVTWEYPDPEKDVQIEPLRAYLTAGGDAVLEVLVRNGLETEAELYGFQVKTTGLMEAERYFSIVDDEDSFPLAPGEEQVLSMIFPLGSYVGNLREEQVFAELHVNYNS